MFRIIDLDNTISDDSWRIPRINWKKENMMERYHNYHTSCLFDEFKNKHVIETESKLIVFTARPVLYREQTAMWLNRNKINWRNIYMRPNNDHTHSIDLKEGMLLQMFSDFNIGPDSIEQAFDDRQDVIEMFVGYGIPATLTKIHDVCAYTKPVAI